MTVPLIINEAHIIVAHYNMCFVNYFNNNNNSRGLQACGRFGMQTSSRAFLDENIANLDVFGTRSSWLQLLAPRCSRRTGASEFASRPPSINCRAQERRSQTATASDPGCKQCEAPSAGPPRRCCPERPISEANFVRFTLRDPNNEGRELRSFEEWIYVRRTPLDFGELQSLSSPDRPIWIPDYL